MRSGSILDTSDYNLPGKQKEVIQKDSNADSSQVLTAILIKEPWALDQLTYSRYPRPSQKCNHSTQRQSSLSPQPLSALQAPSPLFLIRSCDLTQDNWAMSKYHPSPFISTWNPQNATPHNCWCDQTENQTSNYVRISKRKRKSLDIQ